MRREPLGGRRDVSKTETHGRPDVPFEGDQEGKILFYTSPLDTPCSWYAYYIMFVVQFKHRDA